MNEYKKLVEEYPEYVVFRREGLFYTVRNESAFVVNNLMGYRICPEKETYRTGCPINLLDKVLEKLMEFHINFVVFLKEEIIAEKAYEDNEFLTYAVLSEDGRNQYEEGKKQREERNQRVLNLKECIQSLEQICNGTNPISGEKLKKEDLNDPAVIECLIQCKKVVSEVYEDYTKKTYLAKNRRRNSLLRFQLTDGMLEHYEWNGDVKISEFVTKLNGLIQNEQMQKITAGKITSWLMEQEYLVEQNKDSIKTRIPSEQGQQLGINSVDHTGIHGIYTVNYYNETAQKFLLDHLQMIVKE